MPAATPTASRPVRPANRRGASRLAAVQALYQLDVGGAAIEDVLAEFETWRKIRDSDGSEGWVLHSLLSGRRTALVSPWNKVGLIEVRAKPGAGAPLAARLEPRVVAQVRKCDQIWCRVSSKDFDGYIAQKELWGVYPDEKLD